MFKICGDTVIVYNEKDSLSIIEHLGLSIDDERLPPANEFAGQCLSIEFTGNRYRGFFLYVNHIVYYDRRTNGQGLKIITLTYDMFGEVFEGIDNSVDWGIYERKDVNNKRYSVVIEHDNRAIYINRKISVCLTDEPIRKLFTGLLCENNW